MLPTNVKKEHAAKVCKVRTTVYQCQVPLCHQAMHRDNLKRHYMRAIFDEHGYLK